VPDVRIGAPERLLNWTTDLWIVNLARGTLGPGAT
jgi:hypothetical protein